MRKEHRTSTDPYRVYQLSEDSYDALVRHRDNLKLLACLATPRGGGDIDEQSLTYLSLTNCFHRLAEEVDAAVRMGWWQERGVPGEG